MRLLVVGGTGFTGRRVVAALVAAGHEVRCLVRRENPRAVLGDAPVEFATGDLADPASVGRALAGRDGLVNVASIGFGHGPDLVRAAEFAGVRRAVFFSTTAVFTSLAAPSRRVRLRAEEAIRSSGLEWTILRPTMIYGAPGDRNVERLFAALARWPVLPIVGAGDRRIQPVVVDDLAAAVVSVLDSERTRRRAYSVPGRAPVPFRGFVAAAAAAAGRRIALVPVPAAGAVAAARILEAVARRPRLRAEQVLRLLEHKDFDWAAARRDFAYDPMGVEDGLALEAARLGVGRRG